MPFGAGHHQKPAAILTEQAVLRPAAPPDSGVGPAVPLERPSRLRFGQEPFEQREIDLGYGAQRHLIVAHRTDISSPAGKLFTSLLVPGDVAADDGLRGGGVASAAGSGCVAADGRLVAAPSNSGSLRGRRRSQPSAGSAISGARAVCREVASATAPMSGLAGPPMLTVRPKVTPLAVPHAGPTTRR